MDAEIVNNDDSQNNNTQNGRDILNDTNDIEETQSVRHENSTQTNSIEHTEVLSFESVENIEICREETIDNVLTSSEELRIFGNDNDNQNGAILGNDSEKPQFEPVHVDDDDSCAFNDLFDVPSISTINLEPNERAVANANGQIEITKSLGDGEECTYIYGILPVPRDLIYEVKLNDLLTGNIPFKENVSIYQ